MIVRTWHGWTTHADADRYQQLLTTRIVPGIFERRLTGLHGLEVLRRDHDDEVEFVTVMSFEDWDAVAAFTGGDPATSVVPAEARAVLSHHDERSQHYEAVANFTA